MQHKTDLNREQLTINSWPEKFPTHCIHGWNMVRLYIAVISGRNLCWLPPRIIPERIDTLLESLQSMKGRTPSKVLTLLGRLIKVTLWWIRGNIVFPRISY